jgi:hypothetical protein
MESSPTKSAFDAISSICTARSTRPTTSASAVSKLGSVAAIVEIRASRSWSSISASIVVYSGSGIALSISIGANSPAFSSASTAFFLSLLFLRAITPQAFKLFLILFLAIRISVAFFFSRIAFCFASLAAFFAQASL